MHPYELERLAAQRQDDYRREASAARRSERRIGVTVAAALRGMADWLDGGRGQANRLGSSRVLD